MTDSTQPRETEEKSSELSLFRKFQETEIGHFLSSNIVANVATLLALLWAVNSLSETNKLQRQLVEDQSVVQKQIAANEVWTNYIEWSFANPQYALSKFDVDGSKSPTNEKYVWFMERLLSAAEQILNAYPNDIQWRDTFVYEFQLHQNYFLSDYFLSRNTENGATLMSFFCTYDPPVRLAVYNAFSGNPSLRPKMDKAKTECAEDLARGGQPNA